MENISVQKIWIRGAINMSGALVFPLVYHFFNHFLPDRDAAFTVFIAGCFGGTIVLWINERLGKYTSESTWLELIQKSRTTHLVIVTIWGIRSLHKQILY